MMMNEQLDHAEERERRSLERLRQADTTIRHLKKQVTRAQEDVENLRPLSEGLAANVERLRAEIEERKTELSGLNARLLIQRDQGSSHLAAKSRSILEHQCNVMSDSIRSMQHEIEEQREAEGKQRAALEAANNRISSERERRLNILRRIMQRMMHAKMMSVFERWRCAAEDIAAA